MSSKIFVFVGVVFSLFTVVMSEFNNTVTRIRNYAEANPLQTIASCAFGLVTSYLLYLKLKPNDNVFKQMGIDKKNHKLNNPKDNPTFYPDPNRSAKIKRCSQPNDELEIVLSKEGVASTKPQTIPALFWKAVKNGGDESCMGYEEYNKGNDKWELKYISWKEYGANVREIALALLGLGLRKFDTANLFGFCSPRYVYCQLACIVAGILPAGLYTTNNSGQIKYCTNLCKTKIAFVDTINRLKKYISVINQMPSLKYIVVFGEDQNINEYRMKLESDVRIFTWKEFLTNVRLNRENNEKYIDNIVNENSDIYSKPEQCCTISYTSGTTGFSKAVMSSHDNLFFECCTLGTSGYEKYGGLQYNDDIRQVCYLPLSHVAGQILYIFYPICNKAHIRPQSSFINVYARTTWKTTLLDTIKATRPTVFLGVPRMWEKFYEKFQAQLVNASPIRKGLISYVQSVGKRFYYNRQISSSGDIPKMWPILRKYVCNKIKKRLGFDECNVFGSAAAPLNPMIREFFAGFDMLITDGYGMTEVAGATVSTRLNTLRSSALGPPMEGCEVKIEHKSDRDPEGHGEICFRGRTVMMGYLYQKEKTNEIIDNEGWLHSGDVGYFDKYNCLYITGRIKELIITAGGENIAPVPVELYIKEQCNFLSHAVMIGDKRKYCSLLVTLQCETDTNGMPTKELSDTVKNIDNNINSIADAQKNEKIINLIKNAIQRYNKNQEICTSNACKIQYFCILDKDLSIEDGVLSATMKMKRRQINEMFEKNIESMYGDNPKISVR